MGKPIIPYRKPANVPVIKNAHMNFLKDTKQQQSVIFLQKEHQENVWDGRRPDPYKGFADYVYYKYTGKNCGVINTSYKVSEADWSVDKCKEKFVGLSRGSHLRGYVYGNDGVTEIPHSIIILSTDLKGIN